MNDHVSGRTAPRFIAVATGQRHSIALDGSSHLWVWGDGGQGQLGTGRLDDEHSARRIDTIGGVTGIAAGQYFSILLTGAGVPHATGNREGSGPSTGHANLQPVSAPAPFSRITAGAFHAVALDASGNAYSWGRNSDGQLGNNTTTPSESFVPVTMPPGVTFTNVSSRFYHTAAVGSDGNVWAWGDNPQGQIGNGTQHQDALVPARVQLPAGIRAVAVSAGGQHTLALGNDGNLYGWGSNSSGQLGLGPGIPLVTTPHRLPRPPGGWAEFEHISAGYLYSVGIGTDDRVYSWGNNISGQLGTGANAVTPTPLAGPAGNQDFSIVSAGWYHTIAVSTTNWSWGENNRGQLGHSYPNSAPIPGQIT